MGALKNCPCCGSVAELVKSPTFTGHYATCSNERCRIRTVTIERDAAVKIWNNRQTEHKPVTAVWEEDPNISGAVRCSVCRRASFNKEILKKLGWGYCPNCGSEMEG